ncbi:MAG: Asd/ArgC dimerization domain-containing protein, partial [Thermoplasmata archaeon]|nr:Asd/ArgC dimerization domain-containing protein [Thermoplasmata archaeon]
AGDVIIDSKSGTSGAGASPSEFTHHSTCAANVLPYKVGKHRHTPEIENTLRLIASGIGDVSFTPHLVPLVRGIQTSCYVRIAEGFDFEKISTQYNKFSKENHFVRFVEGIPALPSVIGSNYCDISIAKISKNLVGAFSVIDNLCKGGSGQAVQNMNVMFKIDEKTGLEAAGLGV